MSCLSDVRLAVRRVSYWGNLSTVWGRWYSLYLHTTLNSVVLCIKITLFAIIKNKITPFVLIHQTFFHFSLLFPPVVCHFLTFHPILMQKSGRKRTNALTLSSNGQLMNGVKYLLTSEENDKRLFWRHMLTNILFSPTVAVEVSITYCFCDMVCFHPFASFEVGDGARYFEDAIVGTGGEVEFFHGCAQQIESGII